MTRVLATPALTPARGEASAGVAGGSPVVALRSMWSLSSRTVVAAAAARGTPVDAPQLRSCECITCSRRAGSSASLSGPSQSMAQKLAALIPDGALPYRLEGDSVLKDRYANIEIAQTHRITHSVWGSAHEVPALAPFIGSVDSPLGMASLPTPRNLFDEVTKKPKGLDE